MNKTGFPFSANNMVEQTRQPGRVVSPQAGPGEVGADALFDVNLRYGTRNLNTTTTTHTSSRPHTSKDKPQALVGL